MYNGAYLVRCEKVEFNKTNIKNANLKIKEKTDLKKSWVINREIIEVTPHWRHTHTKWKIYIITTS